MKLQVAGFLEHSTVNGEGFRSVLFLSGCYHACPDCHNQAMQDFYYGEAITSEVLLSRILKNKPLIDGVTFSGGEPFEQARALLPLAKAIHAAGLNIWCYSGYTYDKLIKDSIKYELLHFIDILVDGPFILAEKNELLRFRGSTNQHIYALQDGQIIKCLDDIYTLYKK